MSRSAKDDDARFAARGKEPFKPQRAARMQQIVNAPRVGSSLRVYVLCDIIIIVIIIIEFEGIRLQSAPFRPARARADNAKNSC